MGASRTSDNILQLTHPDLTMPLILPRAWLRDACTCEMCVDPSSGQKRFSTYEMPQKLPIHKIEKTRQGDLKVIWKDDFHTHDFHTSLYPNKQILYYLGEIPQFEMDPALDYWLWDRRAIEWQDPFFDYEGFMEGGQEYHAAHSTLRSHGLMFLRNVPQDEKAVERIAEKIGIIQETFYGRTWDVVSKPQAENVAYTSSFLGLHSDLMYMTDPPRIQLLHCLKNTCEGGESIFSDALRARFQLMYADQDSFDLLRKHRVQYWYTKGVNHRLRWHTVFSGRFEVAWSPPFMTPEQELRKTPEGAQDYLDWLQAARKFRNLLEDKRYQYQYKMKEGDCAVFNNLRVLHGRQQFNTATGERWLKGTYVGNESYCDKLRELAPFLVPKPNSTLIRQAQRYEYKRRENGPD